MSSSPGTLPATAPTVLELGNRRALEVSRTIPAPDRLALGTTPPVAPVDAHLIAIGTPPPGARVASPAASPSSPVGPTSAVEPKTLFLGAPAYVPPGRGVQLAPHRPRPALVMAVILGVLALGLAPFGPLAWMHAAEQLDLVARGVYRPSGRRVLHAMQGIGMAMTMIAVAATAFGVTVLVARAMR